MGERVFLDRIRKRIHVYRGSRDNIVLYVPVKPTPGVDQAVEKNAIHSETAERIKQVWHKQCRHT
ncbi:MAG: hypothetical protein GF334_02905 [Candidatus Altiarchaeales archaeon]|nr:hypothetical protein [Candidatus Altiarchaeales archaeon]